MAEVVKLVLDFDQQAANAVHSGCRQCTRDPGLPVPRSLPLPAARHRRVARARAREAERRAAEESEVRDRVNQRAGRARSTAGDAGSSNGGGRSSSSGTKSQARRDVLEVLTKQELLVLAEHADVEGRATMSKPELVEALEQAGVGLDALTEAELLSVGKGHGLEVRSSMSKNDLIAAITADAR